MGGKSSQIHNTVTFFAPEVIPHRLARSTLWSPDPGIFSPASNVHLAVIAGAAISCVAATSDAVAAPATSGSTLLFNKEQVRLPWLRLELAKVETVSRFLMLRYVNSFLVEMSNLTRLARMSRAVGETCQLQIPVHGGRNFQMLFKQDDARIEYF